MELKILEKSDDEMKMEIAGESHTLLNMLKIILLEDERVHTASYDMKHVNAGAWVTAYWRKVRAPGIQGDG
jgi:DNA-directed RNA polymerase subunit L